MSKKVRFNKKKLLTITLLLSILLILGCIGEPTPETIITDQEYELKIINNNYCELTECPTGYQDHTCYYCQKNPGKNPTDST